MGRNVMSGPQYVWPPDAPDREYPSVTTILSEVAKPAIPYWAAKKVAEFAIDNLEAWASYPSAALLVDLFTKQIDSDADRFDIDLLALPDIMDGVIRDIRENALDRDSALDLLKRAPWRERDRAGNVGRAVHEAIERDDDDWVEGDLGGYVQGARRWMADHGHSMLAAEVTVFNETFAYAGTFDGIVEETDGAMALVDWKTGKGLWPDSALQMVAYLRAEWRAELVRGKWVSRPMPEVSHGWLVHLRKDGSYEARKIEPTTRLWRAFVGARSLKAWGDSGGRKQFWTAIQEPK